METAQDYQNFSRTKLFKDYVRRTHCIKVLSAEFLGFFPEHQRVLYRIRTPGGAVETSFTYEELDNLIGE